jgi:hypothetical protein
LPRAAGRTEGGAIAALILGVLGIVACPLVLSIPAVIVGTQARRRIREDPTLEGESMARVGVILGWVGIGLAALGIVIFIIVLAVGFSSGSVDVGPSY